MKKIKVTPNVKANLLVMAAYAAQFNPENETSLYIFRFCHNARVLTPEDLCRISRILYDLSDCSLDLMVCPLRLYDSVREHITLNDEEDSILLEILGKSPTLVQTLSFLSALISNLL